MPWPIPSVYIPWLALALGLVLGSFYNVCIHRWLSGESIVWPGSKCPKCGHVLSAWENIPVVSYLLLGGKCRACKQPIRLRYPLVELVSGTWALGLALVYPPDRGFGMVFLTYLVIGGVLIVASFIDFDSFLLPDILTLPGAVLALAGAYFFLRPVLGGPSLKESLVGAAVGAGIFLIVQQTFKRLKGYDGLGTGDIKLMLLLGALLGWKALPIMITASAVTALMASIIYLRNSKDEATRTMIPFGPFLSFGGMLYILFGNVYWKWVLH